MKNGPKAKIEKSGSNEFQITDAICQDPSSSVELTEGYRHDIYVDDETGTKVPVIMAAASKDKLFTVFLELISKLGPLVDVVLECSYDKIQEGHQDNYREHIDTSVLQSILYDYENLFMNDGHTGIAVLNPEIPQEIQFEEHKLLIIYGSPLEQIEVVLEKHGIENKQSITFITEVPHEHSPPEEFKDRIAKLKSSLGIDSYKFKDGEAHFNSTYKPDDECEGWKSEIYDDEDDDEAIGI